MAGSSTWLDKIAQVVDAFLPWPHADMDDAPPPTHAPTPAPVTEPPATLGILSSAVVINGVTLPENVARELRKLGLPLNWYSHGELVDAVESCALDGNLIDDDEAETFYDRLHLTDAEREERKERKETAELCLIMGCTPMAVVEIGSGFSERIRRERLRTLYANHGGGLESLAPSTN